MLKFVSKMHKDNYFTFSQFVLLNERNAQYMIFVNLECKFPEILGMIIIVSRRKRKKQKLKEATTKNKKSKHTAIFGTWQE